MDPQADLHLPGRDPYGEAVRRRLYIGAVVCGMALLLFGVVMQRTLNLREPYLQYVAPALLGLSVLNLWWLLSRRALIVAEVASVVVLAAANMAQIVLVSLGAASLPGAYPNSGPYWAVIGVCVLAFLALLPRRATPFNLIRTPIKSFVKTMKSERMREGEERVPGVELANRRFPSLLMKQTESV
ncbi:hypothetical protein DESA109040_12515 [Deinococcus saxicola]|uniref:hypothetical protein n=1 Tax=Deinococcus saxicola TaxID=249406 RepID=UPI0039F00CAA